MNQLNFAIRVVVALLMCLIEPHALAQGIAVPIGGALKYDNDEVWSRLVQLAGGKGARYVVFATASGSPDKTAALIVEALTKHGAIAEHIPVSAKLATPDFRVAVADPALIAKVQASTGILFFGRRTGAHNRGAAAYRSQADAAAAGDLGSLQSRWRCFRNQRRCSHHEYDHDS